MDRDLTFKAFDMYLNLLLLIEYHTGLLLHIDLQAYSMLFHFFVMASSVW